MANEGSLARPGNAYAFQRAGTHPQARPGPDAATRMVRRPRLDHGEGNGTRLCARLTTWTVVLFPSCSFQL